MDETTNHSALISDPIWRADLQEFILVYLHTRTQRPLSSKRYSGENRRLGLAHRHHTPGVHSDELSPIYAELRTHTHLEPRINPGEHLCQIMCSPGSDSTLLLTLTLTRKTLPAWNHMSLHTRDSSDGAFDNYECTRSMYWGCGESQVSLK